MLEVVDPVRQLCQVAHHCFGAVLPDVVYWRSKTLENKQPIHNDTEKPVVL